MRSVVDNIPDRFSSIWIPVSQARATNEKIERHESAPRPDLPEAVVTALEFDEPDLKAIEVNVN
jgi:hypothetical protein